MATKSELYEIAFLINIYPFTLKKQKVIYLLSIWISFIKHMDFYIKGYQYIFVKSEKLLNHPLKHFFILKNETGEIRGYSLKFTSLLRFIYSKSMVRLFLKSIESIYYSKRFNSARSANNTRTAFYQCAKFSQPCSLGLVRCNATVFQLMYRF